MSEEKMNSSPTDHVSIPNLTAEDTSPNYQVYHHVKLIPAAPKEKKKKRVAAYCRVSTLLHSQESSIEAQKQHYDMVIGKHEEWEPAGIYLEAGVTGTKAESRPELNRLMEDCRSGRIDLILTKSISRFSRNTADCLTMVRTLTSLGVQIFFEKENIHTGTMESELMLSILASFAEDESHSISENLKWGLRKRFERGTFKSGNTPYGYQRIRGELVIVPDEAAVVREIFAAVADGKVMKEIARDLNARGVPSKRKKGWSQATISQMIRNPVFAGDTLYQKTYVDDQFRQKRNKGEMDRYYERDHHEGIVSREDFERANAAARQRRRGGRHGSTDNQSE